MLDLQRILAKKQEEFYIAKKVHGDYFNNYVAFQAMISNHDLDRLYIEIELLKELITKLI